MQQNRIIPAAAWIACLTIAAYMLAQASAVIIRRNLDAALRSAATATQSRPERAVPPLPRLTTPGGHRTPTAPKTAAGPSVRVEQVSDTQWVLDRASMLAYTRNVNRLLKQARAVPYTKQGRTVGFRITGIGPESLYEKIGLRNGDVLLRVNTRKLDKPEALFGLYQLVRSKQHISLLLSRNGQEQTFNYEIR